MEVSKPSPPFLDRGVGQGEVSRLPPLPGFLRRFRLAILTSHPIQYYAPWFRHLAKHLDLEVLYAHQQGAEGQRTAGFGVKFEWDVPLLDGYRHRWLQNVSSRPGLQTYDGCDTPELFHLIRPENYDALLVIGWNRKSAVQGIRAAWRNKVPVLSRGDSQLGTQRSALKRALKFLPYRWALPRFDAHLYVGKNNRQYLKYYGVRDEQLFFCPHFVDNEFFATRAGEARRSGKAVKLRDTLKIPTQAFVVLFVGKFIKIKHPDDFVQASLRVAEGHKNFHAVLIGDGPLRAELEIMASSNLRQIHFTGFQNQSELPSYYATADLLVLPGCETWGLVVNEAMACGIPAVVSNAVGCAPDLIQEGVTGWTYPTGSTQALAERLLKIRGERERASLRQAVLRKAEEYSAETATAGLFEALAFAARSN